MDKTIWNLPWFLASKFSEAMDFLLQIVLLAPVTTKRQ